MPERVLGRYSSLPSAAGSYSQDSAPEQHMCTQQPHLSTSVACGGAFIMWVTVVLSVPDVWQDCCGKIHPKEYSSYQAFWKFCCEFVMLVSVSLTDGARLLHMELQKLPCFLFLIEVLDLSGLCNCFLKQLIHDCQGTSFLTCSDL